MSNPVSPTSAASFAQPTPSRIRGRDRPSRISQQRPNDMARRESSAGSRFYQPLQVPGQTGHSNGRTSSPFDDGWASATPTAWDSSSSSRSPAENRTYPREGLGSGNAPPPNVPESDPRSSTLGLILGLLEESCYPDRNQARGRTSVNDEELQLLASMVARRTSSGSVEDRSLEFNRLSNGLTV